MSELRQRHKSQEDLQDQQDQDCNGGSTKKRRQKPASRPSAGLVAFLLVVSAAAAAVAAHRMQLIDLRQIQQQILLPLQSHFSPYLEQLSAQVGRFKGRSSSSNDGSSSSSSRWWTADRLFTREELAMYTGEHELHEGEIYISILGQVFDVSSAPQFYGRNEGYGHFAGTDGSKSFITGDFVNHITDDVSDLDAESCLGLMGWLDFYHKTYTYKGKLIGRFFDEQGAATAALQSVHERAKEGERLKAERAEEEKNWPSCNTKWTQEEGGSVWCDDGMYPRKLFIEMKQGRSVWRCACFKELGWSDVRKVYVDCDPDAHFCKTNPEAEAADNERDIPAEFSAMFG